MLDGLFDGIKEGCLDGLLDSNIDGLLEGFFEGLLEGFFEGLLDGFFDGIPDGSLDGNLVGIFDGFEVGWLEGLFDGTGSTFGAFGLFLETKMLEGVLMGAFGTYIFLFVGFFRANSLVKLMFLFDLIELGNT